MAGQKAKARRRRKAKLSSLPERAGEVCLIPTEKDLESDEALCDLYRRHCLHHNLRRTHEDMKRNFNKFKESTIHIVEMNQRHPTCNFRLYVGCDKTYENVPQDPSGDSKDEDTDIIPTEKDLESDEAAWDLYNRWSIRFKVCRSREEMEQRFDTFKEHATKVVGFNKEELSDDMFCLYDWCDQTDEETAIGWR